MDLTTTISQVAASNPIAGIAVARQSSQSALLAQLTGTSGGNAVDNATANLLNALENQQANEAQLLASVQPAVGQNVNTQA